MRRTIVILVALATAGAMLLPASAVQAGVVNELQIELLTQAEPNIDTPTFDLDVTLASPPEECEDTLVFTAEDDDGAEVLIEVDLDAGTVAFPSDAPGGSYLVTAECITGSGEFEQRFTDEAEAEFARGIVDKDVEGDAPDDAVFLIEADCTPPEPTEEDPGFIVELEFDAAGGSGWFYSYSAHTCVVTETDDGGAAASEVSNDLDLTSPQDSSATVTNTFTGATPTPPAAEPAAVTPDFTG